MRNYNFYSELTSRIDKFLNKKNYYSSIEFDTRKKISYLTIWSTESDIPLSVYDIEEYVKLYNTDDLNTLVDVFMPLLYDYVIVK